MEVKNRKVLCYDIIIMVEILQKLSDDSLLLLHEDLISIYKESCITEE